MSERITYIKEVLLISPERALEFDSSIESPFFTSSQVHFVKYCHTCSDYLRPIVYKVGERVDADHLHDKDGGIYFQEDLGSSSHKSLWTAEVEPLSPVKSGRGGLKADSISVVKIKARCVLHPEQTINSGLLFQSSDELRHLMPLCEDHNVLNPTYRFKFEGEQILFSQF